MALLEKIKTIPAKSGVYLMKDLDGNIIYVGKSANLKDRVRSYFLENSRYDRKVAALVPKIHDLEVITTQNEMEALILESKLIKKYKPKYNVLFKDDKAYPYIKISVDEAFPRVVLTRRVLPDGGKYFGPYVFGSVRNIIKVIQKSYKLRDCRIPLPAPEKKQPGRACIKEQLKFCSAPCLGKATREEYAAQVNEVIKFLGGKQKELLLKLDEKMQKAAEKLEYEDAALLRDQKELVQLIALQNDKNIQMSSTAQEDSKELQIEKALTELAKLLNLSKPPVVLEGVDISNISGTNAVGAVVRFFNGEPEKNGYRKFRIKTLTGTDDTGMIKEVVERKYNRAQAENMLPDLVLIDGGKGQLNAAKDALEGLNISLPLISLAKKEEVIFIPGLHLPVKLEKDSAALHLLQYVRDEAHRFAVSYHKTLRDKAMVSSRLDGIEGIGEKTKRKILAQVKDINALSLIELEAMTGVPKNIKEKLRGLIA